MKFIWILGPQAVGKMTVGQELAKRTNMKLFHNHMTIDLVTQIFDYHSKEGKHLIKLFRQSIFEEAAKSDLKGLIFTYVLAYDLQSDLDYVQDVTAFFESNNIEVYFVELEATVEERLARNRTPNRLEHKPSKRDLQWSDQDLLKSTEKYRLNSIEGDFKHKNYLKINNTNLSASEVAQKIDMYFSIK